MKNLVIIDLGSNSIRMTINQRQPDGSYREIRRLRNPVRLADRMGSARLLQPDVMNRAIQVLKRFRKVYSSYPDVKAVGIATAAVRQARNQQPFLDRVKRVIGIDVQVLSGSQEAKSDYFGVKDRVRFSRYVIMDVGGGSLEIIAVNGTNYRLISLPIGAVGISTRFNLSDTVTGADLFRARNYVSSRLKRIRWLRSFRRVPLILLGGAHRALARMAIAGRRVSMDKLAGDSLDYQQISRIYYRLLKLNLAQRRRVPSLEKHRASVIIGGLLPLITLMNQLGSSRVVFSDSGVRQGLIKQFAS